jgi:hypothetical protein
LAVLVAVRWERGDCAAAGGDDLVGFGDDGVRRWFCFVFSFVPLVRSSIFVWYIDFDLGMILISISQSNSKF